VAAALTMTDYDTSSPAPTSAGQRRAERSPRGWSAPQRNFASRVNHALRGDVHAVRMALSAAIEQARVLSLPEPAHQACVRIERAVAHLERRTLDIALLTQAESGALELACQLERIKWVVEEARGNYLGMASPRDVKLRRDLAACGKTSVSLDRALMVRALGALLDNAIRFSPEGGVVTVRGERDDGIVRITVRDQGSGFALDDAKRVFTPFAVGKNAKDGSGNGLGLGLAVAHAIVKAHGGRIQIVKSKEPGGAVAIELPLTRAGAIPAGRRQSRGATDRPRA
jgi:signal transduction histidine kinase